MNLDYHIKLVLPSKRAKCFSLNRKQGIPDQTDEGKEEDEGPFVDGLETDCSEDDEAEVDVDCSVDDEATLEGGLDVNDPEDGGAWLEGGLDEDDPKDDEAWLETGLDVGGPEDDEV